jgi:queuine tRNA-ribosyltransferase
MSDANLHHFDHLAQDGQARLGRFTVAQGSFETPIFMPVGTVGTVKGVDAERLRELGAQIILVNTYHLWLRPTPQVVRALGGIHNFTGWRAPILSDSGGFQIFSLKGMRKLSEDGVEFQSHLDGNRCYLTPEKAIQIQEELGVDIAMVLDECPAADMPREAVESSLDMTLRWARRSLHARTNPKTAIFGITQGGMNQDLRTRSIEGLLEIDREVPGTRFQGFAVGGLSVGEARQTMYEVLSYHPAQLPADRPRYLMGVGTPEDIVTAVRCGIDMFDCVMPTRAGRFGRAFVSGEEPWINIRNSRFSRDTTALDPACGCVACRNYSKGYLHHLMKVGEMLGPQMLSIHNLTHYLTLMRRIRDSIRCGQFESLYQETTKRWMDFRESSDNPNRAP